MTIRPTLNVDIDLQREGVIPVGEGLTRGSFEFTDDEDYFLFAAAPGRRYTLSTDSVIDTVLGVYTTPTLENFAEDDDSGPALSSTLVLETGPRPEVWLIEVDSFGGREPGTEDGAAGPLGSFSLEIRDEGPVETFADPDPVGVTLDTLGALSTTRAVDGAIETPDDLDFYSIYLEADRTYALQAFGINGFDPLLELFDRNVEPITLNDDVAPGSRTAEIGFTPQISGFYFLRVSESGLAATGDYVLSAVDLGAALPVDAADVADGAAEATVLEVGLIAPSAIERAEDLDVFATLLFGGADYRFSAIGYDGLDTQLRVFDQTGQQLIFVDDPEGATSPDAIANFTPDTTGVYFIEVSSFGGTVGDYDVSVVQLDPGQVFASQAEEIALLYEAGLDRAGDLEGLNFWIEAFGAGLSLEEIAAAFIASDEFLTSVGDPAQLPDETFVLSLYENVLDRPADQEGLDFWLGVYADPAVDAADLLIFFSRSPEAFANSETIENLFFDAEEGLWVFD